MNIVTGVSTFCAKVKGGINQKVFERELAQKGYRALVLGQSKIWLPLEKKIGQLFNDNLKTLIAKRNNLSGAIAELLTNGHFNCEINVLKFKNGDNYIITLKGQKRGGADLRETVDEISREAAVERAGREEHREPKLEYLPTGRLEAIAYRLEHNLKPSIRGLGKLRKVWEEIQG